MPEKNADSPKPAEPQVRKLDARSLRGLAHPLRMRLLGSLRLHGPATASQLAEQLGESSGATSYHLRQLAAYGFVEDAPEHGKGRERWWRPSQDGTSFDEALIYDTDPATRGAAEVFLSEIVKIHEQELSAWLGDAPNWSVDWRRSSELSDFSLQLTAEQSHELILKVHDLINSYRDLPSSEGTETVRFHTHAFPVRTK
ncbi:MULTISPECIES: helix-turn-helix domain-containing protein [unclassified Streptomyces]|uniref:ArsR/SmtB family transcription factor n=1 Tax=unclassified Streptomyces TaxID=2593676 RepID=UPI000DC78609|nr:MULTISPECIES: helix-turn-helix domain-containing protein [unclassified Streptomyces]AWZ05136.1 transcriptional regulator [Streptomyces sp. ICC4]AWZ12629.1 transcriptional regulator [Streptomyces sp. ICC1]